MFSLLGEQTSLLGEQTTLNAHTRCIVLVTAVLTLTESKNKSELIPINIVILIFSSYTFSYSRCTGHFSPSKVQRQCG